MHGLFLLCCVFCGACVRPAISSGNVSPKVEKSHLKKGCENYLLTIFIRMVYLWNKNVKMAFQQGVHGQAALIVPEMEGWVWPLFRVLPLLKNVVLPFTPISYLFPRNF
jgi:hypothetical protein